MSMLIAANALLALIDVRLPDDLKSPSSINFLNSVSYTCVEAVAERARGRVCRNGPLVKLFVGDAKARDADIG
jgi:hypothetical protein